jgi:hypothetical protein
MLQFSLHLGYAFIHLRLLKRAAYIFYLIRAIYSFATGIQKGQLPMEHGRSAERLTKLVHCLSLLIIWRIEYKYIKMTEVSEIVRFACSVQDNFSCLIRYKSPCTEQLTAVGCNLVRISSVRHETIFLLRIIFGHAFENLFTKSLYSFIFSLQRLFRKIQTTIAVGFVYPTDDCL